MSKPDELIDQTAKRLAEVEALQETLASVQEELRAYQELLAQKLALLQEKEVVPLPVADEDWEDLPEAPAATLPEPPKPSKPVARTITPATVSAKNMVAAPPKTPTNAPVPPKPSKSVSVGAAPVPTPPAAPPRRSTAKDTITTRTPVVRPEPPPEPEPEEEESAGERRAAPRRGGNPVSVQISNSDGESYQGWVVDRSSGGVRLLVDQSFDAGTILSVRPTKAHPSLTWIKIRVKSCRADRNSFKVGCEFVNKLSWAELQAFG